MIEPSRPQLSFAEGLIQEEVGPLWEEWMREVDALLADRELVQIVYEALARRYPQSRTRGRPAHPGRGRVAAALLKHMRNWSYHVLEREVRANLVYRQFTRVGAQKVPDAKTLGRLALALGPEIIEQIHRRVIAIACEKRSFAAGGCVWIPRSWRPTSTTRPTARCWAMAYGCLPAP